MHQAYLFTGRPISQMALIIFLVLASAALLGVGWPGRLSSLTFPVMNDTVLYALVVILEGVINS